MKYQPVIGLEVHVELNTRSKMFCGNRVPGLGEPPNSEVCPVCLGLPGALPVPNQQAIEWTILIGLALGCRISTVSKFDRKNYFYPDLPKGYQISQYDLPLCKNGKLKLENGKEVRIRRVHLEEDTAKLVHQFGTQSYSLIDFNRSGIPLVEVVTEPDFESTWEVVEYLKKLQQIVRYLGVADADMEKGQMRLEPNVSLRELKTPALPSGRQNSKLKTLPAYKVEIKNINSFRFVERAINYEIKRQKEILEKGGNVGQETRGFDEKRGITIVQRIKEEAQDYRYFPEPDIPPIRWEKSQITNLKSQIPELPEEKQARFIKQYGLLKSQAAVLTQTRQIADFYEEAVKDGRKFGVDAKTIANIMINKKVNWEKLLPAQLLRSIVKTRREGEKPKVIEATVEQVLKENKGARESYQKGKIRVIEFLVGQVLKETKGRGDPKEIREKLLEKLTPKE